MPEKRGRRKTLYTGRKYLVVERVNEDFIASVYGENWKKGHAEFCTVLYNTIHTYRHEKRDGIIGKGHRSEFCFCPAFCHH